MTTHRLQDELARIAEDAPVVSVAPDTWGHARRARVRDRLVGVLATAAVVATVVGVALVVLPPSDDRPPYADGGGLGVPDRLYAVPEHVTAESPSDLAVGTGAAAWLIGDGTAVVVDAATGAYHLLSLPELSPANDRGLSSSSNAETSPLSLSRDGTRLAYPQRGGLSVVDLVRGRLIQVVLPEAPIAVDRFAWSPDGTHLAWEGELIDVTPDVTAGTGRVAGVVELATGVSEPHAVVGDVNHAIAASDDGTMITLSSTSLRTDGPKGPGAGVPVGVGGMSPVAPVAPDGRRILVGVDPTDPALPPTVGGIASIIGLDGAVSALGGVPGDGSTTPLGWSADGEAVVAARPDGQELQVLLVDPAGRVQRIVLADDEVPDGLTVATGLITAERPSLDRPAPDWPWSDRTWSIVIGLGVAAAIAALMGLGWCWRRWRRSYSLSAR